MSREEWGWIRRNPVAAFTSALTVVLAGDTMLLGFGVLNQRQTAMAVAVEGFLTVILGAVTHKNTTSLVKPKDEDGTPLVPITAKADMDRRGM